MKKITYYGATDTGKVRDLNEDTFISLHLWDDRHVLCAAIDGLGGYEGGEVASALARDTIVDYLKSHRDGDCLDLLKQAVTEANNRIVEHQQTTPGCSRMGCVLTAGLFEVDEMRLNVAHVGDSRMYRWRSGKLNKLTHDHSLVGYREDNGELTEEEAMNHPQRNIVERILGDKIHMLEDKNFIEAFIEQVYPGDCFIFCSDGLSDMITSAEISGTISRLRKDDLEAVAKGLIDAALERGGKDNITVVITLAEDDEVGTTDPLPKLEPDKHDPDIHQDDGNDKTCKGMEPGEGKCLGKRLLPWIATTLVALAVGTGAFFGGMQMGINQQKVEMDSLLKAKDTIIGVLADSLKSQQDSIIVLNDSIKNLSQKISKRKNNNKNMFEQVLVILDRELTKLNQTIKQQP